MNTQITSLVEQMVVQRLAAKASFTALDISNTLKLDRYAVTHGEVAEIVRDIYRTGAMDFYDYRRRLIDVTTNGGTKKVQAFLYLHNDTLERDYTTRCQASLPRVPHRAARDLTDSVPAGLVSVWNRRQKQRRDGAFAIPRSLVAQLGWSAGMSLGLSLDGGQVRLGPSGEILVQVWSGQRVRICLQKLRLCGLMPTKRPSIVVDGDGLRIEEN
jgi:hypothetical protein